MRRYQYDYYRVSLPGDMFDTLDEYLHFAIEEARERARLWVMPCDWVSKHLYGKPSESNCVVIRVCRRRRRVGA